MLSYNKNLEKHARENRKAHNLAEVLLWLQLKKKQLCGFDFTRQQIIGNYIVDFYCAKIKTVIEIDGESHDNKGDYDVSRDKYLEGLGLTVLHIKDYEVKKNMNEVMRFLENYFLGLH